MFPSWRFPGGLALAGLAPKGVPPLLRKSMLMLPFVGAGAFEESLVGEAALQ